MSCTVAIASSKPARVARRTSAALSDSDTRLLAVHASPSASAIVHSFAAVEPLRPAIAAPAHFSCATQPTTHKSQIARRILPSLAVKERHEPKRCCLDLPTPAIFAAARPCAQHSAHTLAQRAAKGRRGLLDPRSRLPPRCVAFSVARRAALHVGPISRPMPAHTVVASSSFRDHCRCPSCGPRAELCENQQGRGARSGFIARPLKQCVATQNRIAHRTSAARRRTLATVRAWVRCFSDADLLGPLATNSGGVNAVHRGPVAPALC
ncbi:hypothetical protein ERJ75_000599200 [Trypanosoma vivax]|nr:hypothetical protein ERJ75_000599200 [Trypanosoma vivax]